MNTIRSDTPHRSMVCPFHPQFPPVDRRERLLPHRRLRAMMLTTSTKRHQCKCSQSRHPPRHTRNAHHLCLRHRPNHLLGHPQLRRGAPVHQWKLQETSLMCADRRMSRGLRLTKGSSRWRWTWRRLHSGGDNPIHRHPVSKIAMTFLSKSKRPAHQSEAERRWCRRMSTPFLWTTLRQ